MKLEEKSFSLSDLILTINSPFQALADEKGLKLIVSSDIPSDYVVKGDPVRVRQILWNLLSNAIKFTDKGYIFLTIKDVDQTAARHLVENPKDRVVYFAVEDTGVGITPDGLNVIFDAFTQEDTSITRRYGGTGLGLSIVKQLTDLMGGNITVTSELEEGTTFILYLSFNDPTMEERDVILMRTENSTIRLSEPMNVLIAEDNEVNAAITKAFLEKFGHSVRHVENGKLAVEAAKEGWADLILMDIHMPEMNGVDATKEILATDIGKNIPIIGLTADAFAEHHIQFRKAGMIDVLTKPFSEQQLANKLSFNKFINRRKVVRDKKPSSIPTHGNDSSRKEAKENELVKLVEPKTAGPIAHQIGDEAKLNAFRELIDAEIVSTLLEKAQESLLARMDEMRHALEESNPEQVRLVAHTIKGSSGQMFAMRVPELAEIIENKSSDLAAISKLMPEFEIAAQNAIEWWRSKST